MTDRSSKMGHEYKNENSNGIWLRAASTILFFGAIWGTCEATLGFILHQALAPFTGLILFPIGYVMMRMAQSSLDGLNGESTSTRWIPILVACVAATIKLVDLFIPGAMPLPIINPAMAILSEGLLVSLVMPVTSTEKNTSKDGIAVRQLAFSAFAASFGWRILYVLMLTVESSFGLKIRLFKAGTEAVITFLTVDALINGVLVLLLALVINQATVKGDVRFRPHPLASTLVLMMAIVVTLWTK